MSQGFLMAQMGMNTLGSILSTVAAGKAAKKHAQYEIEQTHSILNNFTSQANQTHNRYAQEQEASSDKQLAVYLQNLQAKAAAQASAASSGVQGSSIDNLFRGYDRATAISNYTAARNLKWKQLYYDDAIDSYKANAISAINQIQPYQGASPLSIGIQGLNSNLKLFAENYQPSTSSSSNNKSGLFDTAKDAWIWRGTGRKVDSNFTVA